MLLIDNLPSKNYHLVIKPSRNRHFDCHNDFFIFFKNVGKYEKRKSTLFMIKNKLFDDF